MDRRNFCKTTMAALAASTFPDWRALASSQFKATEINAVKGSGEAVSIESTAINELSKNLRGLLLLPDSEGYEQARQLRNRMIDKRPALIAQCLSAGDVREAVNFARHYQLLTAVRCGGHNVAGKGSCNGGIMIDLSPLQGVRVDPHARTARVAGGSLLGSLDQETQAFGLVTTSGTVSHTGVGGLTLGGGFGRLARKHGLASDNLRTVDIITADGEFQRASALENPDLYWGVRGGGGNFGVVTSFEFELHPMQHQVIGGEIFFPYSEAKELLKFYADYCQDMSDEMYADIVIFAPPAGLQHMVYFNVCYSGDHKYADRIIEPLRRAGKFWKDDIRAIDYVTLQADSDDTDPRGTGQYLKSGFTTEITSDLIDALVDNLDSNKERGGMAFTQQAGGAISRIDPASTAFPHRYPEHNLTVAAVWRHGIETEPHVKWARQYWKEVEKYTHGFYSNDEFAVTQSKAQSNFLGNHDRMVELKNKYDPGNLFRLNSNVRPTIT